MTINTLINNHKTQFDKFFFDLLKTNLNNSILSKAMIYGSMNGGKRIRPFLVSQAAKIAKEASSTGESIKEVAKRRTSLSDVELGTILDPYKMSESGFEEGPSSG